MTFRTRLIALISALVLMATACGGGAASDTIDSAAPSGEAAINAAADTGDTADTSAGPDLGLLGQGSLEGQDVVVWFWAEW